MAIVNRRLKVMHIISGDLWAGAEVQAFNLLSQLQSRCDLHIVLMNNGELADRLTALNISLTVLDELQLNGLQILSGLRKVISQFKPDIIHTHRQKENILGNIANLLSIRARSVRTCHGAPEFSAKGLRLLQVWFDKFVGRYMQQAIIAVSAELGEKLAIIFPLKKIHIINNGVDIDALRKAAGNTDFRMDAPQAIHVGIVGRLEPVKRIDIFLKMAAILLARSDPGDYRFHVIGDGKLRPQLEQLAKELGLEKTTQFHGHRKDMPACLSSLDVIVMCSDHEGTPMTALEALALGTPLIAHKTGGLEEILSNYEDLLVEDHEPNGYAQKLFSLISSPSRQVMVLDEKYFSSKNGLSTFELYVKLIKGM